MNAQGAQLLRDQTSSPSPSAIQYKRPSSRDEFDIAIICALRIESDAVEACFDQFWDEDGEQLGKARGDQNAYTLGRIHQHNVVLAYMPGMGTAAAAAVTASFRSSFTNIRLGLVVGICAGVPNPSWLEREIFLGDVLVSTHIIQHDFGGQYADGILTKDTLKDQLGRPNHEIRTFLRQLEGWKNRSRLQRATQANILQICHEDGFETWTRPQSDRDHLFPANYRHKHHDDKVCQICAACQEPDDPVCKDAMKANCTQIKCDETQLIPWYQRRNVPESTDPLQHAANTISWMHFGSIASGNQVIKSSLHRDRIAEKHEVIGFEMEGAGAWDNCPTIVVKAVCDYADSHKDKHWQKFTAVAAAACAKAILGEWRGIDRPPQPVPQLVAQQPVVSSQDMSAGQRTTGDTFNFNNKGTVHNQAGNQHNYGPVHNGPVFQQPANYGSQVGYNYGSVTNNDFRGGRQV